MDLKKAFREYGWTLERVAERLVNRDGSVGITPSCLSQSISSGALSLKRMQEIAEVIGIPLWRLMESAESKRTPPMPKAPRKPTQRIKEVLKSHGWTTTMLAEKMRGKDGKRGITQGCVSRILNGNPTLDKLKEVSVVTGIPLAEFFSSGDSLTAMVECRGKMYKVCSLDELRSLLDSLQCV